MITKKKYKLTAKTVSLNTRTYYNNDIFKYIIKCAKNRCVLNVGAAGGVETYLPENADIWLHEKLIRNAASVTGVDFDKTAIEYAKKYNYDIDHHDCEKMNLNKKFDIIVLSDVIEHLNSPVVAIHNLVENHLNNDGTLFITTPNASCARIFIRSLFKRDLKISGDHVAIYLPENFQVIVNRLGYKIINILFFDHIDKRNLYFLFKSLVNRTLSVLASRFANSFLVSIKK